MEEKLNVDILIGSMELLKHLTEADNHITSRICLDEIPVFEDEEQFSLETELNNMYPKYTFKIVPVFSGYAQDLLITNKQAKAKYDDIPKTKTYSDVYRILHDEHGIHSSGTFVNGLNEKITDEEFDSLLKFHISLSKMTAEAFKK
ncbi:hypothetical protein [Enterococcus sp. AZ007]|uniref:hypothetical protein n=1 Tax=Enterococcus sp. AZ007 TaxID=2774839 RepID=UPI003F276268